MPTPLQYTPDLGLMIGANLAFSKNPKAGLAYGAAVAIHADLEAVMGWNLAVLMQANAEIGVAMYNSVQGTAAQINLLLAAARHVLHGKELELFKAVVSLTRATSSLRHTIAHAVWACSETLPETLILVPPKAYVALLGRTEALQYGLATGTFEIPYDVMMCYRESDFIEIRDRIDGMRWHWARFFSRFSSAEADRLALFEEPEIAAELARKARPKPD